MTTRMTMPKLIVSLVLIALAAPGFAGLIGTDQEKEIGKSISDQLEGEYGLQKQGQMVDRVRRIGEPLGLLAKQDRAKIDYKYNVLEDPMVNAVACPGGWIYAFKGLMKTMAADEELAAVMAHESAHVSERHGIQALERALGWTALLSIATGGNEDVTGIGLGLIMNGYSRKQESEADQVGQIYLFRAGYDVRAMARMLEKLHASSEGGSVPNFLRSHPSGPDRIRAAKRRETEILLALGSERPADNPPHIAVVYLRDPGEGSERSDLGKRLAEDVMAMLNNSAQVRVDFAGVKTSDPNDEIQDLTDIIGAQSVDSAVGLRFSDEPIQEKGSRRDARTTVKIDVAMTVVSALPIEDPVVSEIESKAVEKGSRETKKLTKAIDDQMNKIAQEVSITLMRPPAPDVKTATVES